MLAGSGKQTQHGQRERGGGEYREGNSAGNISLEWVQRIKLFDVLHCPFGRIDDDHDEDGMGGISPLCLCTFC